MKKILVTGGAGFIGSHLCERLIIDGHFVICLDDLSTGRLENIEHLLDKYNFKFVKKDVCEPYFFEVDEIYNLACPASPEKYQKDPVKTAKTSFIGVLNGLELAKKAKIKFLQASTSEIYGDPIQHPQKESYTGNVNPIGIRACYDEGKRIGETLCFDYNRTYGVEIKVVRIFNTYGPRMDKNDGRVISNFINQCLVGKPITIYGNGEQTRSFQYINDLIEGLIKMMNTTNEVTGPFNLGNENEFTIRSLAEKTIDLTKSKSEISYHPLPLDDPKVRRPDISKARSNLNWQPLTNLDEGLIKTIDYFKRHEE